MSVRQDHVVDAEENSEKTVGATPTNARVAGICW